MRYELPTPSGDGFSAAYKLQHGGPKIDCVLAPLPCWDGLHPVALYCRGMALLDTGSDVTLVRQSCLVDLKIPAMNGETRDSSGGDATLTKHEGVCIAFPQVNFRKIPLEIVFASPLKRTPDVIAVIGRDVLQHFRMTYDGLSGMVILDDKQDSATGTVHRIG